MIALVLAWACLTGAHAAVLGPPAAEATSTPSVSEIEEAIVVSQPERMAELRELIWSTPLGLLLNDYLFEEGRPDRVTQRAHQISTRVFASVRLKLARLSALQIMYEDLYERGKVDTRVQLRIDQLNNEVALKTHIAQDRAAKRVLRVWPVFVVMGVLGGSHIVREQTGAAFETVLIKLGLERRAAPAHALRVFEPGFIELARDEFFAEYSVGRATGAAVSTAGMAAGISWFFQSGAEEGSELKEQAINYFQQTHTNLEDL